MVWPEIPKKNRPQRKVNKKRLLVWLRLKGKGEVEDGERRRKLDEWLFGNYQIDYESLQPLLAARWPVVVTLTVHWVA